MESVGLRELRQGASDLVRRVEAGEEITITVAGRPGARLVPVQNARWVEWGTIAELFDGHDDASWGSDRELVDDSIQDPWERA